MAAEAVYAAFASAPLDSLCGGQGCGIVLLDTLARVVDRAEPLRLERVGGTVALQLSRLRGTKFEGRRVYAAPYLGQGVSGDTIAVGFALVRPAARRTDALTAMVFVESSSSYGYIVVSRLVRARAGWRVVRVTISEG